jgi:hypothetical protein
VLNRNVGHSKRRNSLIWGFSFAALIVALLLCNEYRRYAVAIVWHCVHGNYAEVGGNRVKLPLWWWKESTSAWKTSVLTRASSSRAVFEPQIEVKPALPGAIPETDQEALESARAIVSSNNRQSAVGARSSLVTLKPTPFPLYCARNDAAPSGEPVFTTLYCHTARVSYVFTYSGPTMREKEAESILSTLQ